MAQDQPIALEVPSGLGDLRDLTPILNDRLRTIALHLANLTQPVAQQAASQTIVIQQNPPTAPVILPAAESKNVTINSVSVMY